MSLTRRIKDGNSYCGECRRLRANLYANRASSGRKEYWRNFKRDEMLKKRYGITKEELFIIYQAQGGKCAICPTDLIFLSRQAHTDHDHVTGKVRGILCSSCNHGLGMFKDKPDLLNKAIGYLLLSTQSLLSTAAAGVTGR